MKIKWALNFECTELRKFEIFIPIHPKVMSMIRTEHLAESSVKLSLPMFSSMQNRLAMFVLLTYFEEYMRSKAQTLRTS